MPSTISAGTTAGTAIAVAGDTTGNLAFQTNGTTTAMTIDTSQNVGVGTTSPARQLHVFNSNNAFERLETTFTGAVAAIEFKNSNSQTHKIGIETSAGNAGFNGSSAYALCLEAEGARDICFATNSANRGRFTSGGDFQFNSGYGSVATAYGCRAWVNWNGTDNTRRGSGNVSSITINTTGDYTINFTNAMPDVNYAIAGYAGYFGNTTAWLCGRPNGGSGDYTTTSCRVVTSYQNTLLTAYTGYVTVAIFR